VYEEKKQAHAIELLKARVEATEELLTLMARALTASTSPGHAELRQALDRATTYAGPAGAKQALARLAKAALGGA
jgi:hypothetical protein